MSSQMPTIYDRHIPLVKELISREPTRLQNSFINPDIKDFYDFTVDDFYRRTTKGATDKEYSRSHIRAMFGRVF